MKQLLLSCLILLNIQLLTSQTQLVNAGFEQWKGKDEMREPIGWHALMTASGSGLAYKYGRTCHIEPSLDIRPGSTGKTSLKMYSTNVLGTIIVGSITTGQFNVENIKSEHPSNHAVTRINNPEYHQSFSGRPRAISFWAKFSTADKQYSGCAGIALHDSTEFNTNDFYTQTEQDHVIARAFSDSINSPEWKQYTIPFVYTNSKRSPDFIFVIFSTNAISGQGSQEDVLFIDDIECIY